MLTSEGGSEDLELEETLAMEGIDLPTIIESWRTRGIEAAPEEEIKKVNELFIARQKAELEKQNRKLGIVRGSNPHYKELLGKTSGSKQKRRRSRKTSREVLQELGEMLRNAGKIKQLSAFPSFQSIV